MTLSAFLDCLINGGLCKLAYDPLYQYLSFGNIAVGIELLGACLDEKDFHVKTESQRRFKRGISEFMEKVNPKYDDYNTDSSPYFLYKQLRCGMAHLLRPQGRVGLTHRAEAKIENTKHLDIETNRTPHKLILIAEDFSDDFAEACRKLQAKLPDLEKKHPKKLKGEFLTITT